MSQANDPHGWESGYPDRYDYRVDILRRRNLVTASINGVELARSERSLLVDEQDHGLVIYFPRGDVNMNQLVPIERSSHCPYKGIASYWGLARAGRDGGAEADEPIAWSYAQPYPQVAQIAGYIAFYQNRVTVALGVAEFTGARK
ncbi:MAG: DUF427 domain-containing protein [Sphingomonadales bacterium]|nr:DUF427 domain-containing protein [Sphingomonadales bacterium]MBU3993131.1 DUF427 domain-containing protein [Alphaproteobacteria bacterium]